MTQNCKELLSYRGKICDLHVHSHFSDGSLSPSELVDLAIAEGISAFALTDHNTIGGLDELLSSAEGKPVKVIPGIEFSTDYRGVELHVVALGVGESAYAEINKELNEVLERKRLRMEKLLDDLIAAGYEISRERTKEGVQGIINRAHVAMELVRCGYVSSRAEAFEKLLYSGGPFYKEPKYMDTLECFDLIRGFGAVSVLAHPFLNMDEEHIRMLLAEADGRLDAIEVVYSEYDEELTSRSLSLCEEFGLLPSGGSDFHGKNKPDIALGKGKGNLAVPLYFAENMKLI